MALLERFSYIDPDGREWVADAGVTIDGATIPRPLWTLLGSPYTGDYRRASIVHDVATDHPDSAGARRAADRMFFHACRAGGCSLREAIVLYVGVRIGAHLPQVPAWQGVALAEREGARLRRSAADDRVEADFRLAAENILAAGETGDVRAIEERTDAALSMAAQVDLRGR